MQQANKPTFNKILTFPFNNDILYRQTIGLVTNLTRRMLIRPSLNWTSFRSKTHCEATNVNTAFGERGFFLRGGGGGLI